MPDEIPPSQPVTLEPTATTTNLTPNLAAGLAAIFPLLGGIVFLAIEKRNAFVRFWAMQSVFFGVACFVFSIASGIIGAVLGGVLAVLGWVWSLVSLIVSLGLLAVWVISIVQALNGKEWEIPLLGKLARQQLGKMPPSTL